MKTRELSDEEKSMLASMPFPKEKVGLFQIVPEHERNRMHDIAAAYAVEVDTNAPGGCIIWGFHRGEWVANASARWIVSLMLASAKAAIRNKK